MPAGRTPLVETPRAREILAKVRLVPPGSVTTYGDLCPEAPRFAGAVLAACRDASIPWHRVVRANGSLAKGSKQRRLLEREGTPLSAGGVDMRLAWVDVAMLAAAPPAP
jgi:methylated-DNA-protein-cysteine methyltransferase-like protein